VLTLITTVENISAVKIEHSYRLHCGERLLASASSTLACVDRAGKIQRLPESVTSK
jgi:acyl-CoA thioester hydrolase